MGGAVLGWDAWAGDAGIKHANAVELGGTPESAVARAMERSVQKLQLTFVVEGAQVPVLARELHRLTR